MKGGSLDREITLQRVTITIGDNGAPAETWADFVTLRAALVANAASEQPSAAGAFNQSTMTFKTRYFDGLAIGARVLYQGQPFELRGVQEIGRRRGLELTCKTFGP